MGKGKDPGCCNIPRESAYGTVCKKLLPSGLRLFNNPGITDAVVEGPFLLIKGHHQVTNPQNERTHELCKESTAGSGIADLFTVRPHHPKTACHFPGGGAVRTEEIRGVANAKDQRKDVLDNATGNHVAANEISGNANALCITSILVAILCRLKYHMPSVF